MPTSRTIQTVNFRILPVGLVGSEAGEARGFADHLRAGDHAAAVLKDTHRLPSFRYGVVGAGAVGLYYGAKLAWRGRDVRFLLRSGFREASRVGVRVRSREGDLHVQGRRFHEDPHAIGPVDVVLVALPAGDEGLAARLLGPLVGPQTAILRLRSGLGGDDGLPARLGAACLLEGVTSVAAERINAAEVRHFGGGGLTVADAAPFPQPILHDLASEFRRCGVPFRPVWRLAEARWERLAWDVAVRGVSLRVGRVPLFDLLQTPKLRRSVQTLAEEVASLAEGAGTPLQPRYAATLLERAHHLGTYRPPPLQWPDGSSELEPIWGEAWRRAQAWRVAVPALEGLYHEFRHRVAPT